MNKTKRLFVHFAFILVVVITIQLVIPGIFYENPVPVAAQVNSNQTPWIAFIGKDYNVGIIHPDGSGFMQITADASTEVRYESLNWSPDGKWLAFARRTWKREGSGDYSWMVINWSILGFSAVDSQVHPLVAKTGGGFDWLSDSQHIIYDLPAEYSRGKWGCEEDLLYYDGLYSFDINTGQSTKYYTAYQGLPVYYPNVSPDDSYVIITNDKEPNNYGSGDFFTAPTDGSDASHPLLHSWETCDWSADGKMIACDTWRDDACDTKTRDGCPITLFSPTGGFLASLPTGVGFSDLTPTWSPTEGKFAVNSTDGFFFADGPCAGGSGPYLYGENNFVDIISAADMSRQRLTNGILLGWSPDGNYVMVLHNEKIVTGRSYTVDPQILIVDIRTGDSSAPLVSGYSAAWQPENIINPITGLEVIPGSKVGEIILQWDVASEPGVTYQARFSQNPIIDEQSWQAASTFNCVPLPVPALNRLQCIDTLEIDPYARFYFSVRSIEQNGTQSKIGYSPWITTSGFWINQDSFTTFNNMFATLPADFMLEDMWRMYGDQICSEPADSYDACNITLTSRARYLFYRLSLTQGNCLGMAVSSQRFFNNLGEPRSTFMGGVTKTSDILLDDIRRELSFIQLTQKPVNQQAYLDAQNEQSTLMGFITDIKNAMSGKTEPAVVLLGQYQKKFDHAVVPIGLEQINEHEYRLWIYNPYEQGVVRYIMINEEKMTWEAPGLDNYRGDATTHNILLAPLSKFDKPYKLPGGENRLSVFIVGGVDFMIVDEQNRFLRETDGVEINNIPGASLSSMIGEGESSQSYEVLLPVTGTYRLELYSPQDSPSNGSAWLGLVTPSAGAIISGISLNRDGNYAVVVTPGAFRLDVIPGDKQVNSFTYLLTTPDQQGYTLKMDNVTIAADQAESAVVLPAEERIVLLPDDSLQISRSLLVENLSTPNQLLSMPGQLSSSKDAIYSLEFAGWDGKAPLPVRIDTNGDGRYEENTHLAGASSALWGVDPIQLVGAGLVLLGLSILVVVLIMRSRVKRGTPFVK